jgi:hypothetical protein
MERMPYWIQRADFSSADGEAVDVKQAIEVASAHDWSDELRLLDTLEAAGRESCPPGIGFVASSGRILHICPGRDGTALVHYHFSEEHKTLGIIPASRSVVRSERAVSFWQMPEFIRRFYADDHTWLCQRTSAV